MIIVKLKTKTIQRTELCKYETDTVSDGSLMPIRMIKVLYPNTKTTDVNKSIGKKYCTIIYEYHKWEYAMVIIINKGIKFQFSFLSVPGNGQALLRDAR